MVLAGNANVGKSAAFKQQTGVDQIIGNWPGKTAERAGGMLHYKGRKIKIVDLPGIYSFSTYSMEELLSRDFVALEKPDMVVNVIDASALETQCLLNRTSMGFLREGAHLITIIQSLVRVRAGLTTRDQCPIPSMGHDS